jgi:GNAT superfamily N-acetyltransferase
VPRNSPLDDRHEEAASDNRRMFELRYAVLADAASVERLIEASARGLSPAYTIAQVDAAIGTAFGLDRTLIADGTYFIAQTGSQIVGCGGWSRRATLFGGDRQPGRRAELLDPARDAARIRAFFVRPDWARRGIGRAILARCEAEARSHGFASAELVATVAGCELYRAFGYVADEPFMHRLTDDVSIQFIPMRKRLDGQCAGTSAAQIAP